MRDLNGKKALVCGGSEGIGLASAQALAALGADVTLLARREATLLAALESLHASGSQTHGRIVADVNALEPVLEQIRAAGFDMLINNSAGPAGGARSLSANSVRSGDGQPVCARMCSVTHRSSR